MRPVLDLHQADDLHKFRQIEAMKWLRSSPNSKARLLPSTWRGHRLHRVSQANRSARNLTAPVREIKHAFDPNNLFNPGKIISTGRYKIDDNLRQGAGHHLQLPFEPQLAFASRDESFTANLEQCNGCGGCLKQTATMCPTFIVTGEEGMSTRGRANLIRAALEQSAKSPIPCAREELEYASGNSPLPCRACTSECPSNVNMTLLKAELLHARIKRHGLRLSQRLICSADLLGRVGAFFPRMTNFLLNSHSIRQILGKMSGLTSERPFPAYTRERFDRWFEKRGHDTSGLRGRVVLWDDTFVPAQ